MGPVISISLQLQGAQDLQDHTSPGHAGTQEKEPWLKSTEQLREHFLPFHLKSPDPVGLAYGKPLTPESSGNTSLHQLP